MSSRTKCLLKAAFLTPFFVAIVCILTYFAALYPQEIPTGLANNMIWLLPLSLLALAALGVWIFEFWPDTSEKEKRRLPLIISAYLVPFLVLFSLWKRVFGLPEDDFAREAMIYGISLFSLVVCFAVQFKMNRNHQ